MQTKQHIIVGILVLVSITFQSKACDVCGCATNQYGASLLPNFTNNFLSIQSSYLAFRHPNSQLSYDGDNKILNDYYLSSSLIIRAMLNKKIQFTAALPYKLNLRQGTLENMAIHDFGDIKTGINYFLVQKSDSISSKILLIGLSVKLPNGKYQKRSNAKLMYPLPFQIGSGAYNYTGDLTYSSKKQNWGFAVQAQATYHFANELHYQLGASFTQKVIFTHWYPKQNRNLIANFGFLHTYALSDLKYGNREENTGIQNVSLSIGLTRLSYKSMLHVETICPLFVLSPMYAPIPRLQFLLTYSLFYNTLSKNQFQ